MTGIACLCHATVLSRLVPRCTPPSHHIFSRYFLSVQNHPKRYSVLLIFCFSFSRNCFTRFLWSRFVAMVALADLGMAAAPHTLPVVPLSRQADKPSSYATQRSVRHSMATRDEARSFPFHKLTPELMLLLLDHVRTTIYSRSSQRLYRADKTDQSEYSWTSLITNLYSNSD